MTERQKMISSQLYRADDPELTALRRRAKRLMREFEAREEPEVLRELLGSCGEKVHIEATFKCDYGFNIHLGERFYANFDCIMLDGAEIRIGDDCLLGPRVCLYTAGHPVETKPRVDLLEFSKPISIGHRCWLGGNSIVLPGVTIGDEVVVGAGAVVTKDVPDGSVVAGNPARVIGKG